MRILLDEGVPVQVRKALSSHIVITVQEQGWSSLTNGNLLAKAEGIFDLFITADQNLKYQQNLRNRQLAILELSTNRRRTIEENLSKIADSVAAIEGGAFVSLKLK